MATNSDLEQILQACLEMIEAEGESVASVLARYPEYADALRPELEAAYWFQRQMVLFGTRRGYVGASSQRLVNRIRQEAAGVNGRASARRTAPAGLFAFLRQRRVAWQFAFVFILIATLFLGSSGIALAAQGSLPGERLYRVKTTLEKVGLAVTPGAAGDTRLHTLYAQRRLVEIQSLVLEGRFEYIAATVADYESELQHALAGLDQVARQDSARAAALAASLKEALYGQQMMMAVLEEVSPQEIRSEFQHVQQITQQGLNAAESVLLSSSGGAGQPTSPPVSDTLPLPALPTSVLATEPPAIMPSPTPAWPATATATALAPGVTAPQPAVLTRATATPTARPTEPLRLKKTDTPTPTPTETPRPGKTRITRTPRPTNTHRPPRPTKELQSDEKPAKPPRPPGPPRP